MGWWGKKKDRDEAGRSDQALALQDPRTRVHTTSAATETTNTAVQNSTIFDNNKNTVTYLTTRQTVTHTQQARVTEMITRRTPSQAELEELFAQLRMNGGSSTTSTTSTSSKRMSPSSLNGVALRSTPSFKASVEPKRSSTVVKVEQTSVSQKQGRSVTQHVETRRLVLNPKTRWPPSAATTTTATSAKPYVPSLALKPLDYVSPYARTSTSVTSSTLGTKPTLSKPLSTSSVTSSTFGTKPTLSTPRITTQTSIFETKPTPKPFVSLNSNTGAVPKRYASSISTTSSSGSRDARGELKPTISSLRTTLPTTAVNKKKLKPAEVIILNHEKFDNQNETRTGSAEDVKALEKTFMALKCKVQIIKNATVAELRNTVRKLEQKSFDDRSALVLVVMSHGMRNDNIAAKDGHYNLDDDVLFHIVKNRSLQNKPKILFVQACKGARETGGFKTDSAQPNGVPSEILKCYSTFEGYVSYRYDDGTPFIQILCETLKSKPNVDIVTIMDEVRSLVKVYTKDTQIPSVTTTLTTKYIFGDYS